MRANTRVHNSRSKAATAPKRARLSPRKPPVQDRSRATVEAILAAAARVLIKDGYDGATTNRIAEIAGVSVGSLYQYFPSKEAIVRQLCDRHVDAMWEVFMSRTVELFDRPVAEAVPGVIDALMAAHLVEPRLHRVLTEQVPRLGKVNQQREINRRAREVAGRFLEARRAELTVRDLPTAAFVVVEIVEALIHATVDEPDVDPERVRTEANALVLRYLAG